MFFLKTPPSVFLTNNKIIYEKYKSTGKKSEMYMKRSLVALKNLVVFAAVIKSNYFLLVLDFDVFIIYKNNDKK